MNLIQTDTDLFLWINQHHCTVADWVLWVASQNWSWAIVLVSALLFTTLRHEPRRWWLVLIGIALCFLLADRTSVYIKYLVCRPRPCHALEGVRMFRTSCGGDYGFVSSHAANVFALAMFLTLRYRKSLCRSLSSTLHKRCHRLFPILIFLWAVAVGYSRPYLGKHYPGDVICGALLGLLLGTLVYLLSQLVENLLHKISEQKKLPNNETK
ncbi:MAG: phosphatase PAP2 family protein [Bacteroidales bacterium]|nr:phosphatase PAP2 family protein [Bacteroidales bacterium]